MGREGTLLLSISTNYVVDCDFSLLVLNKIIFCFYMKSSGINWKIAILNVQEWITMSLATELQ